MSDIESVIGEAMASAVETPVTEAQLPPETPNTEPPAEDAAEPEAPEAPKEEMFPKKAVNAISRRDKMIGKLRAELAAERAKNANPQKSEPVNGVSPTLPSGEPNPEFYQTYDELNQARIEYSADKKVQQFKVEQKENQLTELESEYWSEREAVADAAGEELMKTNPEYAQVIQQNVEIIRNASPEIKQMFLEADNAALALFNLAKEGKLAALASMTPTRAAMEIARAQVQAPPPPKSKAPAPLAASRGSIASTKSVEDMSPEEAFKWFKSQTS